MAIRTFSFNLGSRDLFPEEEAVANVVERVVRASAAKHGLTVMRSFARITGTAAVGADADISKPSVSSEAAKDAVAAVGSAVRPVPVLTAGQKSPRVQKVRPGANRQY